MPPHDVAAQSASQQHARPHIARRVFWFVFTVALCAVLWALMVGTASWHEFAVGVFAVALTMVFITLVYAGERHKFSLQARDLLLLWRLPAEVLAGIATLLAVLACDLAGRRAGDWFRFSGVVTAKDEPALAGRRVLLTMYGSVAPDTIVVGVDYAQNRLLLHQLRRAPLSTTLRRLGARP